MLYKFSQWLDRGINQDAPKSKICDHPDCEGEGIHRAPKSRYNLQRGVNDWYWFCLNHIRDYNAQWNYYTDMPEKDQMQDRIDDVVWQRPSWPLGASQTSYENPPFSNVNDPFGFFEDELPLQHPQHAHKRLTKEQTRSINLFNITYPFTQEQLTKQYRLLAKQHHPDANNNSTQANESFRKIGEAYQILLKIFDAN